MRKLLILLSAVAFVVAFTLPAAAADWNFYGSARMSTFYESVSEEVGFCGEGDDDLTWGLQGNSRIGATVKTDGPIGGGFEYGSGPNLRKLYGTVKLGNGTLLVGQTYTPVNFFQSNQVFGGDTDLLPYGGVYDGRRPMLQYAVKSFKLALVQPNDGIPGAVAAALPEGATTDTDTTLPKVEASYGFNAGPAALRIAGGYQTFDAVACAGGEEEDESIDSMFIGLAFNIGLGAAYVNGNVYTGSNLGAFGLWQQGNADWTIDADGDVEDNESLGYLLVAGFKASPKMKLEAGFGSVQHDRDDFDTEDDTTSYYVQMTYNLAKGAFIVPEIGMVDYGDTPGGDDGGDLTYFGAKWQINF